MKHSISTSSGRGEWPASSSICSLTAMTVASRFFSKIASDSGAFLGFQIGEAVMPKTFGRTLAGAWKYSRMIPLYAWFLRVWWHSSKMINETLREAESGRRGTDACHDESPCPFPNANVSRY